MAMLFALDSVRWDRLLTGMATMVRQGPSRRSLAARQPATIAVPDLVNARHAAVVKAARRAKRSGVAADFHRVRIRGKRLRYSLEFTAELYGGRTTRYTRRLTGLQDQLGLMQDAEVAAARLTELAAGDSHLPPATIFVMGAVAEHHRRDGQRLMRRIPKQFRGVGGGRGRTSCGHGAATRPGPRPPSTGAPDPARRPRSRPWAGRRTAASGPAAAAAPGRRRHGAHRAAATAPITPGGTGPGP